MIDLFPSIILAWFAVLFTALSAAVYLMRKSGNRKLRRTFSRFHIAAGVLLIVTGVLHGILAGNPAGVSLGDITPASELFTLNWGTLSLVAAILLAVSYVLRRKLKKRWMTAHRVLTVVLIALVALHVSDVGIQLGDRIKSIGYAETMVADTDNATAADTVNLAATATTAPDAAGTADAQTGSDAAPSTQAETAGLVGEANAMFSGAVLADGVYEGSATGYRGTITVSVTVSGGAVTDISVTAENDTPSYFNRAESVIDTIVEDQSLEVDAVSGATYSSAGIVNAVADALSAAVQSGTLGVTAFTASNSHGGHGH